MLLRCGHHGQWQISNINYRNLFFCHVCIAMPNTPKSRLQTHLLYLIWVLSVIAASPLPLTLAFSHTLLLCVCCDVCEGNGQAVCVLVERKQLKKGNEMSIWHCFLSRSSAVPSLTSPLFLSPGSNLKAAGGGERGTVVECWTKWVLWWAAAARRSLRLLLIYVCFVCLQNA